MRSPSIALGAGLATGPAVLVCCKLLEGESDTAAVPVSTRHEHKGTASVGDFITFQLDSAARTFSYANITNGMSGSGTFTVNSDGSYTISE